MKNTAILIWNEGFGEEVDCYAALMDDERSIDESTIRTFDPHQPNRATAYAARMSETLGLKVVDERWPEYKPGRWEQGTEGSFTVDLFHQTYSVRHSTEPTGDRVEVEDSDGKLLFALMDINLSPSEASIAIRAYRHGKSAAKHTAIEEAYESGKLAERERIRNVLGIGA